MKPIFRVYDKDGKDVTNKQNWYIDISTGELCYIVDNIGGVMIYDDENEFTYCIQLPEITINVHDEKTVENEIVDTIEPINHFFVEVSNNSSVAQVYDKDLIVFQWTSYSTDKALWEFHSLNDKSYNEIAVFTDASGHQYVAWSCNYIVGNMITRIK